MIFAKKSFGQHFLKDQSVLKKIVDAAMIGSDDVVVEIGPGRGALTEKLAAVATQLVLVEADRELIPELQTRFSNATIVQGDAAKVNYAELVPKSAWILVGNLPYNAGNAIIKQALTSEHPPKRLVVMVQREVGEKMIAKPGDMSLLSVAVQMYCTVERVVTVKPGAFLPPPKVDSMVLRLDVRPEHNSEHAEKVIALAKSAFAHKRKQLHRTLADAKIASSENVKTWLREHGLVDNIRPEDLTLDQWVALAEHLG